MLLCQDQYTFACEHDGEVAPGITVKLAGRVGFRAAHESLDGLFAKIAEILRFSLAAAAANEKSGFSTEIANFPRFSCDYNRKF